MSPIRLGVVGLGAVAQAVHLPLVQRRWDLFELVSVADLSPALREAVGGQFGVPPEHRHPDLASMLEAERLDGVLLLTSGSHGPPALAAIEAGVPVFCEKPLALSLAEADALAAAEQRSERPMLLLAYMKEYDPAVLAAREALPSIGPLRWIEVEVLHPSGESQLGYANLRPPARDADPAVLGSLRALDDAAIDAAVGTAFPDELRPVYANLLLGSLVHDLAVLRHLVGPLESVDDAVLWEDDPDSRSIDIGGSLGGARARLHWHYLPDYPAYRETVTLHGERGTVRLVFGVPYLLNAPTELTITTSHGAAERTVVRREVTEAFESELAAFAAMVSDGARPPTGVAEGRADIRTAQAIARALAAGRESGIGGEAAEPGHPGAGGGAR